jgi:hypothetical protein
MIAAILSAANERGLLRNLPEALMGFLTFVTILLVGIPLPWLLGWALGSLVRQARPPRRPPRRRRP